MREVVVKVPEGWFLKFSSIVAVIIFFALAWPFYSNWLARNNLKIEMERAQVTGECHAAP